MVLKKTYKKLCLVLFSLSLFSQTTLQADDSFFPSFAGSFAGSAIGNAVTRDRSTTVHVVDGGYSISELNRELRSAQKEIRSLNKTIDKYERKIDLLESKLDEAQDIISDLQDQVKKLTKENAQLASGKFDKTK